ncbi:MAG: alpha/beta fold hydrolase [Rhodospirillales bacterium]|nr:alpha/beta fold hydrolase [Rhodospirillales bacterium]
MKKAERTQRIETVVLLHGIGHSLWNMMFVEKALQKAGYETLNLSYPSRKYDIKTLARWLQEQLTAAQIWERADKVHFVAHSMGGLVTGFYLGENRESLPQDKMGRAVMLGTPHGGSEVADFLKDSPLYQWLFGPAGQELTTEVRARDKVKLWYDLGMIAGTQNWMYPLGKACIHDDHDGCVSVGSTYIEGMKDHIVIPVMHGFMGWDPAVHRQILCFLEKGAFNHETS